MKEVLVKYGFIELYNRWFFKISGYPYFIIEESGGKFYFDDVEIVDETQLKVLWLGLSGFELNNVK